MQREEIARLIEVLIDIWVVDGTLTPFIDAHFWWTCLSATKSLCHIGAGVDKFAAGHLYAQIIISSPIAQSHVLDRLGVYQISV